MGEATRSILRRLFTPIVLWCVRSGVGYAGLVEVLREFFLCVSYEELSRKGQSITDDSLSLASGVHKSAVRDFRKRLAGKGADVIFATPDIGKVSFSDRVMASWLALDWPSLLPLKKGEKSFKRLCEISSDRGGGRTYAFIPPISLIIDDMERRGLIKADGREIKRLRDVPRASIHDSEVSEYIADSVSDHFLACLDNVEEPPSS